MAVVLAIHALLCMAEKHVHCAHVDQPAEAAAAAAGHCAHRRFLEVASLVLLKQRQAVLSGQLRPQEIAAKERCLACLMLVLEQLVQAGELAGYGDLQAFVPYQPCGLATYVAIGIAQGGN